MLTAAKAAGAALAIYASAWAGEPQEARSVYDEGFWLLGEDDKLKVSGSAQFDTRVFLPGSRGSSNFQIRRARLFATGVLEDQWGFLVMGRWDRGAAGLHQAWIESRHWPSARIRVGQFKQPYSLEAVNSDQYLDFDERSLWTSNLSQIEDLGVMVNGRALDDRLEYAAGAFNGRGRDRDDTNPGKEAVAQLSALPAEKALVISASASVGRLENDLKSSTYTTAAQTAFWTYSAAVVPEGDKTRMGAELEWYSGPASLKGGAHEARLRRLRKGASLEDLSIAGWNLSASCLLTGETKPRNAAIRPLGKAGALEVAARAERLIGERKALDLGYMTGTPQVGSWTLGANWYLNRHMRAMLALQRSIFSDSLTVNGAATGSESTVKLRLQFEL